MVETTKQAHRSLQFLDIVLRGYSAVLFSQRRLPAILFLAATFYDPFVGMLGLLGNVVANLLAVAFHTDRSYTQAGVFGLNGTLTGLAVGLYVPHGLEAIVLLLLGASLATIIALSLLSILTQRRNLPILSLPFVITTWTMLLAIQGLGVGEPRAYLVPTDVAASVGEFLIVMFPSWSAALLKMFGSTLFQPTILSGLLVVIGVLITSRLAFAFGILGAFAGLLIYMWMGGDIDGGHTLPLGLNYILIAMALGGFFVVPTLGGALYAFFGVAIGALVVNALTIALAPLNLPLLVAPFNIVVIMLLYPLRSRILYAERIGIITLPLASLSTPEEHRRWYIKRYGRKGKIQYQLPFYGTWYVMQGEFGQHTHKGTQAHAYDFIVVDENEKSFRGVGLSLEDYYCFGLPILAPASGTVAAVVNHISDNAPGMLNEIDNWGNYVIIKHAEGEYTEISHFKQYSIAVKAGDEVKQGQVLGLCGNSGYSAQPHLHIQRQKGPFVGAETMPLTFVNLSIQKNRKTEFCEHGKPAEGSRVASLSPTAPA